MLTRLSYLILVVIACAAPATARAQPAPTRRLVGEALDLHDAFTRIGGVRELADGRTLVVDWSENRLNVANWRSGAVQQVGVEGRGPGEYRYVGALHALARDSSLLVDGGGRFLLLDDARIVETIPYAQRRGRPLPLTAGADRSGRILVTEHLAKGSKAGHLVSTLPNYADSVRLLLEDRASGRREIIAMLDGGSLGVREARRPVAPGNPPVTWRLVNPLAVEEQAVLFPDGWTAVVRRQPYRVDWRAPSGRWRAGTPLPFERVSLDGAQKSFAMRRHYKPSAGFSPDDVPPWPTQLPPFSREAVVPMPDGRVAIRRMPDARIRKTMYDIVDRQGRLSGRLELAENERIAGFGQRSVYVVEKDGDDLEWLRKHPWP